MFEWNKRTADMSHILYANNYLTCVTKTDFHAVTHYSSRKPGGKAFHEKD